MTKYTQAEIEAVAVKLGFQNSALMVEYFKAKLLREGLYEALNAQAAAKVRKH